MTFNHNSPNPQSFQHTYAQKAYLHVSWFEFVVLLVISTIAIIWIVKLKTVFGQKRINNFMGDEKPPELAQSHFLTVKKRLLTLRTCSFLETTNWGLAKILQKKLFFRIFWLMFQLCLQTHNFVYTLFNWSLD